VHRHSASKTRVNALMALHRIRETQFHHITSHITTSPSPGGRS
jgi:hypothetical protein